MLRRRKSGAYTTPEEGAAFVQWFVATGELVTIEKSLKISRDPKDDKFLDIAIAGQADYLISGDKDLLVLGRIGAVPIISPAAFMAAVNH